MKLIEPPLAEPHERWCERSEIPQSEEFPPTRLSDRESVDKWCADRMKEDDILILNLDKVF